MKTTLLTLAMAALAIAAAPAHAGDRVMALRAEGEAVKPPDRARVDEAVRAKLGAYPGLAVVPAPEGDITDLMIELECVDLDGACLGAIGARGGADRVVHVELAKKAGRLQAKVRWIATGTKAITRTDTAEVGAPGELPDAVAGLVAQALGPLPEATRPPEPAQPPAEPAPAREGPATAPVAPVAPTEGTLVIETNRVQSQIFVGDEYAGTGSATVELPAGRHVVRITHPGDESQILTVEVVAGRTMTRQVTLEQAVWTEQPAPGGGAAPQLAPRRSGTWLVWVIVGAVVVAGAATGAALAAGGAGSGTAGALVIGLGQDGAWMDPVTQRGRR
jgi:hypothetical protein